MSFWKILPKIIETPSSKINISYILEDVEKKLFTMIISKDKLF